MSNFTFDITDMCEWEQEKALFLLRTAKNLGMKINDRSYGQLAVNNSSGYTYLWLEDYPFTLYMPINCELNVDDVYALYSDPEDGEETETSIGSMDLSDIDDWAQALSEPEEDEE